MRGKAFPGPLGILKEGKEPVPNGRLAAAAGIVARYGKGRNESRVEIAVKHLDSGRESALFVSPQWEIEKTGCIRL